MTSGQEVDSTPHKSHSSIHRIKDASLTPWLGRTGEIPPCKDFQSHDCVSNPIGNPWCEKSENNRAISQQNDSAVEQSELVKRVITETPQNIQITAHNTTAKTSDNCDSENIICTIHTPAVGMITLEGQSCKVIFNSGSGISIVSDNWVKSRGLEDRITLS